MRPYSPDTIALDLLCELIRRLDDGLAEAERARDDLRHACARMASPDITDPSALDASLDHLFDLRERLDLLIDSLSMRARVVEDRDDPD